MVKLEAVCRRTLPTAKKHLHLFSDPAKPVVNAYAVSGAHDYRELAKRADVLTFDSAPMERDTEVTGPIHAQIYFSCDCRDTDLWVRLLDVAPDGTAFNLMSPGLDVLRASYRDPKKAQQLLKPDQIYQLRLDNLITSNVFRKEHRIRVQVSADIFPQFLTQSADWRPGSFVRTNAEGEYFYLHRPPPTVAHYFANRAIACCGVISRVRHFRDEVDNRRISCRCEPGFACCSVLPSVLCHLSDSATRC